MVMIMAMVLTIAMAMVIAVMAIHNRKKGRIIPRSRKKGGLCSFCLHRVYPNDLNLYYYDYCSYHFLVFQLYRNFQNHNVFDEL